MESYDDSNYEEPDVLAIARVISEKETGLFNALLEQLDGTSALSYPWEEVTILPDPLKRFSPDENISRLLPGAGRSPVKRSVAVEITGPSTSGKSTVLEALSTRYQGWRWVEEFEVEGLPTGYHHRFDQLSPATRSFVLAKLKVRTLLNSFQAQLAASRDSAASERDGQIVPIYNHSLLLRGPHDILARDIPVIRESAASEGLDPLWISKDLLTDAVSLVSEVNAVVLLGVSFETAKARGLSHRAEKLWGLTYGGCSAWLEYIYPIIRTEYGTGLVVLNGENPLEENIRKVWDYIEQVRQVGEGKE